MNIASIKTILLVCAGFLLLGMGMIGLLLPVWPTTPFVLAAAGCFASTPRLHARMMKLPFFRDYIQSYREKNGLPKKTVAVSLIFLWAMLLLSALLVSSLWLRLLLLMVGAAVTTHILWIAKPRKG